MNNNLNEDYCSFEISKLLKEKGFDVIHTNLVKHNGQNYFAPTHSLTIKWIRENFIPNYFLNFFPYINRNKLMFEIRINGHHFRSSGHKTPEEATETALLYTLKNLI